MYKLLIYVLKCISLYTYTSLFTTPCLVWCCLCCIQNEHRENTQFIDSMYKLCVLLIGNSDKYINLVLFYQWLTITLWRHLSLIMDDAYTQQDIHLRNRQAPRMNVSFSCLFTLLMFRSRTFSVLILGMFHSIFNWFYS